MEQVFEFLKYSEDQKINLRKLLVGIKPTMLANMGTYSAVRYLYKINVSEPFASGVALASLYFESSNVL